LAKSSIKLLSQWERRKTYAWYSSDTLSALLDSSPMRILTLRFFATISIHLQTLKLSTNLRLIDGSVGIKGQLEKSGQVA